ncbi:MAG: DNA/RNA nuclease SfsA [Anaerolineae bacterium]|nr:DNA/RNA nuclease SfsA [Anaerolineae bacterium]
MTNSTSKPDIKTPFHTLCFPELRPARFLIRENRFRVKIQLGDRTATAHLANPGRLKELLLPGASIWVSTAHKPERRTPYSLELVKTDKTFVSLNSQIPNKLVDYALKNHTLPQLPAYIDYRREVKLAHSRIDFLIHHQQTRTWIEVKSVTLVNKNIAAFPDAPTQRGRRHLETLISAVEKGDRRMVLFIVQRQDAMAFTPNEATDPDFGRLLREAQQAGVSIKAINCIVTTSGITMHSVIPVLL